MYVKLFLLILYGISRNISILVYYTCILYLYKLIHKLTLKRSEHVLLSYIKYILETKRKCSFLFAFRQKLGRFSHKARKIIILAE